MLSKKGFEMGVASENFIHRTRGWQRITTCYLNDCNCRSYRPYAARLLQAAITAEAEILILRHQLNVLQRRTPRRRLHLRWIDRALFTWLYRRYPRILDAMSIVRPETVVRWHRKGLARYWRWKSRSS